MAITAIIPVSSGQSRYQPPSKPKDLYHVREIQPQPFKPASSDGYRAAKNKGRDNAAIVIDSGSSAMRAGWSFEDAPRYNTLPIHAKHRERKFNRTFTFVGADSYCDVSARGNIRTAYETNTGIITNWDVMENALDYMFIKLGLNGQNGNVDVPVVMTEAAANLPYARRCLNEIMFELYGVPSLAYGIDSLFSYRYNRGSTGLVVSSSHSSTHVIPVFESKPLLSQCSRLNWGGVHGADYLAKLIRLKYPSFQAKQNLAQAENAMKEHCYVSQDYQKELKSFLQWSDLDQRDRVIQFPYVEEVVVQKSQEELDRQAEKRIEASRRLREQAAKQRFEKLVKKEQELEYYRQVQTSLVDQTKKEIKRLLDVAEVKDEVALSKLIKDLDFSIRRSRQKDLGGPELEQEVEIPDYSLLEIPDEELDEETLKKKRHLRLMKAGIDARERAKQEKAAEQARLAELNRLDVEKRENDLDAWIAERRSRLSKTVQEMKDRKKLTADLGNRKSLASQIRMKSLANLASDAPNKKRRRGDDDDKFGMNDDDWAVYRDVGNPEDADSDEEEEDLDAVIKELEAELLQHDPNFTEENTLEAQNDWTKSMIHAFLRGPEPLDYSQAENNQIHLNVERIRVPEVIFQPNIAGVDQGGLVEIITNILNQRLHNYSQIPFSQDIFLTGGNTLFRGFDERLRRGLRAEIDATTPLQLRGANDRILDAWRGASQWVTSGTEWKEARVTRAEWDEVGGDYLKDHNLGNAYSST